MSRRKVPLVTNQIYHVLNRGIISRPIFQNKKDYERMLEAIFYYQNQNPLLSYSHFTRLHTERREEVLATLRKNKKFLVHIICLCLMPNHFHLLLKQLQKNGISVFIGHLSNSYVRYFNTKNERVGPLFQGKFKAVIIETNEQLLHVSRYIHLNPYSSVLVKSLPELKKYPYSSLLEYLDLSKTNLFQKEIILDQFKDIKSYQKFVDDQAEYQRQLENIKHLTLESNYTRGLLPDKPLGLVK